MLGVLSSASLPSVLVLVIIRSTNCALSGSLPLAPPLASVGMKHHRNWSKLVMMVLRFDRTLMDHCIPLLPRNRSKFRKNWELILFLRLTNVRPTLHLTNIPKKRWKELISGHSEVSLNIVNCHRERSAAISHKQRLLRLPLSGILALTTC